MTTTPPTPDPKPDATEPEETVASAGLADVFGAITLVTPTWTILRHPFGFSRYREQPGAAIHYLYAAIGLAVLAVQWTDAKADDSGGDAAPILALINRGLALIGPNARIDGGDGVIVMLLIGNLVSGLTAYWVCRLWARLAQSAKVAAGPGEPSPAAQTMAATAYFGGAASVIYAVALLIGRGDENNPVVMTAGGVLLFLVYCWGRWVRTIHGVARGRLAGASFPFALALACLALFAGLVEVAKALAQSVVGAG